VEISNDKLVGLIADILDIKDTKIMEYTNVENIRPGHDLRYALDGSKLKNMGWKQPVPFEESLKQTVLWTKAHEAWLKP
jgi:dTDP-glucose 4,6-dehydratase